VRGKAVAAVAGGMLALAIGLTLFSAWRAELATRPQTVCTLKFDVATLDNVPQVTTIPHDGAGAFPASADVGPGLLFTWADDAPRVFWMKDTPTPLSVAFIDAQGVVLQIEDMEPFSEFMHWSRMPAREGLEVKQGDFQRLGIAPGSRLISRQCKSITN